MFDAVSDKGISIKVGSDNKTAAKFFIESQKEIRVKTRGTFIIEVLVIFLPR